MGKDAPEDTKSDVLRDDDDVAVWKPYVGVLDEAGNVFAICSLSFVRPRVGTSGIHD